MSIHNNDINNYCCYLYDFVVYFCLSNYFYMRMMWNDNSCSVKEKYQPTIVLILSNWQRIHDIAIILFIACGKKILLKCADNI